MAFSLKKRKNHEGEVEPSVRCEEGKKNRA
jgi:hypothetical protein